MYYLYSRMRNVLHTITEHNVITWTWKHEQCSMYDLYSGTWNVPHEIRHGIWLPVYEKITNVYIVTWKCSKCNIRLLRDYLDMKTRAVFHVRALLWDVKCSQCNIRTLRGYLDMQNWAVYNLSTDTWNVLHAISELYLITYIGIMTSVP